MNKDYRISFFKAVSFFIGILLLSTILTFLIISKTIFPMNLVAGISLKNQLSEQDFLEEGWKVKEVSGFTAKYLG